MQTASSQALNTSSVVKDLSHPFHDGYVNVASAIGAVITLIFFALVLTTAYVTYMVYFKGVTHFEDISAANLVGDKLNAKNNTKASERKEVDLENDAADEGEEKNESAKSGEEELDQDSSRTPVKGAGQQRPRPNTQNTAANGGGAGKSASKVVQQVAKGIKKRMQSPAKSPGKRGPVGHDEIEFEIIEPQPTEDDIRHTTSMNGGKQAS